MLLVLSDSQVRVSRDGCCPEKSRTDAERVAVESVPMADVGEAALGPPP
jgi:hypothetical protein